MAGHSAFKNIMHRKARVDARRSRVFSKHARLIITAARSAGGDPAVNLSLRYAVERARLDNMTNDAIERAVRKGTGALAGEAFESVTYEGYGPGGVALLVETLTDNRARTFGEVRNTIESHGGSVGAAGSVAWNFQRKAVFVVAAPPSAEERLLEALLEAEADACEPAEGGFEITAEPTRFAAVQAALETSGFKPSKAEIAPLPKSTVTLQDDAQVQALVRLIGALDELDDVQATATNLEWTEQALAAAERS